MPRLPSRAMAHRGVQNRGLLPLSLPLAIPSIPVVAPILTLAAIGDQPSTPTTTTTKPASSPTTGSGSGSGAGSGAGNGAGNGSGNGSGNGGSNNNSPPASSPSQPAAQNPPSNPSVPTQGDTPTSSTNSTSTNDDGSGDPGPAGPVQNAAVEPSPSGTNLPVATDSNGHTIIPTGLTVSYPNGGVSQHTAGFAPSSSDTPSDNDGSNLSAHTRISKGAIGGIVAVLIIVSIFATLFLTRRYHQRRRASRRAKWLPAMSEKDPPSTRSSFATNIDHGLRPSSAQSDIPALPPAIISDRPISDGLDAQWLVIDSPKDGTPTDHLGQPLPSPISVRPFSPSESYKFPRPPSHASHSTSDGTLVGNVTSPQSHSSHEQNEVPPVPATQILDGSTVVIKRPFAPSLPDEVYVEPGHNVVIEDAFDDSWALVRRSDGAKGLIPIACFEACDQDVNVTAFLSRHKRKSSLLMPRSLTGVAC